MLTQVQSTWNAVKASLQSQFDGLDLPNKWTIDDATWQKFRRLSPSSVSDEALKIALIENGYVGLTPAQLKALNPEWDFRAHLHSPWKTIRAIFYRTPFGDWQEDGDRPFVRLRLPDDLANSAKYLSAKGSAAHIFFPYGLSKYCGTDPANVWKTSPDGDDLEYATTGEWILTEGEDKSIVSSLHGYPCLALAGVDMWRRTSKLGGRGLLSPLLFDFACRVRKLTLCYDSDASHKPRVVAAMAGLLSEFKNHLAALATLPDSQCGAGVDYCSQTWGEDQLFGAEWAGLYGSAMQRVSLAYSYLPPNPTAKGLDDILAVAEGTWLDTLLRDAPSALRIDVTPSDNAKKPENKVKVHWLFSEPNKLGLVRGKLDPIEQNSIGLMRGALTAGWLQLNYWRHVGDSNGGTIYAWNPEKLVWEPAPTRLFAAFAFSEWSRISPTGRALDGVNAYADLQMSRFGCINANQRKDGTRFLGVGNADVDLENGTLHPISPANCVFNRTQCSPVEGVPEKFLKFYGDRIEGGRESMERLLSLLAVHLRSPGAVHSIGWIKGRTGTGKSTLMKLLREYVLQNTFYMDTLGNLLDSNSATKGCLPMASLGARFVIDDDFKGGIGSGMVSLMNMIATNSPVPFRSLGKDPLIAKPDFGLWFISNKAPGIKTDDMEGLGRRFQIFEFLDKSFTPEDYATIEAIVIDEAPTILSYILSRPLGVCASFLTEYCENNQGKFDEAMTHSGLAGWVDDLYSEWIAPNVALRNEPLPDGNYAGRSTASIAMLSRDGQQFPIGFMGKALPPGQDGTYLDNYLPASFVMKIETLANGDRRYTIAAKQATWQQAAQNFEKGEVNMNGYPRGAQNLLTQLETVFRHTSPWASKIGDIKMGDIETGVRMKGGDVQITRGWAISFVV